MTSGYDVVMSQNTLYLSQLVDVIKKINVVFLRFVGLLGSKMSSFMTSQCHAFELIQHISTVSFEENLKQWKISIYNDSKTIYTILM